MRSRCHHRPLNRHARVCDCWGCTTAVGRGHSASSAAAIAAASSSVGAGVIEVAATIRPYRTRLSAIRAQAASVAAGRRRRVDQERGSDDRHRLARRGPAPCHGPLAPRLARCRLCPARHRRHARPDRVDDVDATRWRLARGVGHRRCRCARPARDVVASPAAVHAVGRRDVAAGPHVRHRRVARDADHHRDPGRPARPGAAGAGDLPGSDPGRIRHQGHGGR